MKAVFQQIKVSRALLISMVDGLSAEEFNLVPDGYNNNIAWNLGHILVSTEGLCYKRTGVDPNKQIPLFPKYSKGTKPESFITIEEIEEIKKALLSSIDALEADYNTGIFTTITAYATDTYKHTMHTIEEVIACTLAHDNYHIGYVSALKKSIQHQLISI